MNTHSHSMLAKYLAGRYLAGGSAFQRRLFHIGCIQPDKNPTTYLRGFTRSSLVQGHNWHNSRTYILETVNELLKNGISRTSDYYKLGKLIHYLSDAFTFTHNHIFIGSLPEHRAYELELHNLLRHKLHTASPHKMPFNGTTDWIDSLHSKYLIPPHNTQKDIASILSVCCYVMEFLLNGNAPSMPIQPNCEICM